MVRILVGLLSFMSVQGAFAADSLKVHINVQRIVIDNTNTKNPTFEFSTMCEVDSIVKVQDIRANPASNQTPKAIEHNCSFDFLGAKQSPTLWADAGVYLLKTDAGDVTKYSMLAAFKMADDVLNMWGIAKEGFNDLELVVNTPDRSAAATPERKESLRVTYQFYK